MEDNEQEGVEIIADPSLSSLSSDSDHNNSNDESSSCELQEDYHQKHLLALHESDEIIEIKGEKYIQVHDDSISIMNKSDSDNEDEDDNKPKAITDNKKYKKSIKKNMIMFRLKDYSKNEGVISIISFGISAIFIVVIILLIILELKLPFKNVYIINIFVALFSIVSIICALIGLFFIGYKDEFYLNFNTKTNKIYLQRHMCLGLLICGNKGYNGKYFGDLNQFVCISKTECNDIYGEDVENTKRYLLNLCFKDNAEVFLYITTNDQFSTNLEHDVNEWWKQYQEEVHDA